MNYYLGIFGGVGANPSAALLKGKKIIAFAEEERFNRIKNSTGELPINSIFYCLKEANISIDNVKMLINRIKSQTINICNHLMRVLYLSVN